MLLTKANRKALPALYSQANNPDPIVHVKFFNPTGRETWYATEFDGEDIFFGLVIGHEAEMGYFSLTELTEAKGRFGLGMERDRYFAPCPLSEARRQ
jgi:hypothetical protein